MSEMNNGYELGWDSEIENEGTPFVIAEPGDYNFTVVGFERGRFNGSQKMPPCNQAKLTIRLELPDKSGVCDVKHNLFLHSKTEWKLCEFFTAIGCRSHGQRVKMDWSKVVGATGRCKVSKRKYTGNDGKDYETNDIDKFYDPPAAATPSYQQNQQPQYQTPTYQAPPQQPAQAWQGGKF